MSVEVIVDGVVGVGVVQIGGFTLSYSSTLHSA